MTPTVDYQTPQPQQPNNTLAVVSGAVGATVGLALGRYTGLYLLIPILLSIAMGWTFAKFARGIRKPLAIAFGLHAGQAVWVFWYIVFITAQTSFFFDLIVLGIATLWILVAPSLLPLLVLSVFQIIMLIVNGIERSRYPMEQALYMPASALSVQIILRVVALVVLAFAIRNLQKMLAADRLSHPMSSI